jgi:hypothetical protein
MPVSSGTTGFAEALGLGTAAIGGVVTEPGGCGTAEGPTLATAPGGFAGAGFGLAIGGSGASWENRDIARSLGSGFVAITTVAIPTIKPVRRTTLPAVYALMPARCSMRSSIFI